jgi:hypothetical protein
MNNETAKKQWRFLVEWSILNLVGLIIGIIFVFMISENLESIKHLAWTYGLASDFRKAWTWEIALVWFPLGLSVGVLQWIKLRRFGINLFVWTLATTVGCVVFVALYSWAESFYSNEQILKYHIPFWITEVVGLVLTMAVGGSILGGLQAIAMRKCIWRVDLWIGAYIFGLVLPALVQALGNLIPWSVWWYLFIVFLFMIPVLCISILTGNVLWKQSIISSATINAG